MARLRFALSFLEPSSSENHLFDNMHSYVHVDEKWFYLTKVRRKFYVYEDEEIAARSVKSKGFITKVMFLAAVARPRYDYHRKTEFDGKIGVRFAGTSSREAIQQESAKRIDCRGAEERRFIDVSIGDSGK
ncbi:hypothetical protein AeMF1_020600, partial [Aphanomyces euteiches]